ncbi:MAG: hypothetical protein M1396_02355, partial [Chloroflexi bacterium]|nr:hypothetical protein [Chloroflexota bacterium]
ITVTGERLQPNLRGTFFPDALFQATLLMTIVFFVLLAIVHFAPPTVGAPAEPLNQELYLPRPAWYFYFLFQLLEWAQGPILVPIATFYLPTLGILALLLLPFYDRNKHHNITKRPLAILLFYGPMLFIILANVLNAINAPAEPTQYNENHAPAPSQGDIPSLSITW